MGMGLKFEVEKVDNKVIGRLEGRLDAASSYALQQKLDKLIEEKNLDILLDFTRVDYLSSAGMRLLLSTTKKLKTEKGCLVIFALTEDVNEIIKFAGFHKILNICSNEQEALRFSC